MNTEPPTPELERLEKAATPGEYGEIFQNGKWAIGNGHRVVLSFNSNFPPDSDWDFIVALRNAAPALFAAAKRAKRLEEACRAMDRAVDHRLVDARADEISLADAALYEIRAALAEGGGNGPAVGGGA